VLDIEPESVAPLLDLARSKLAALADSPVQHQLDDV
jgi:hypothetical protein